MLLSRTATVPEKSPDQATGPVRLLAVAAVAARNQAVVRFDSLTMSPTSDKCERFSVRSIQMM